MSVLPRVPGGNMGWGPQGKNGLCAPCEEASRRNTAGRAEEFDFIDLGGLLRGCELDLLLQH